MTKKAIITTHDGREATIVTKASNVLFEDGQTAQDILNDRQDTMITPIITTSTSMSKVGQGDNVDYSANVVNGAYESMVLKGNTKVNLIQESSSQDVVLPYEFTEGQYVTINDTKETGALGVELKGRTLVNLCTNPTRKYTLTASDRIYYCLIPYTIKANNVYTFCCNLTNSTTTSSVNLQYTHSDGTYSYPKIASASTSGKIVTNIVNSKDITNILIYISNTDGGSVEVSDVMIIEGDYTNVDIPYFEGMQSVQVPSVTTVGKNLAYIDESMLNKYLSTGGNIIDWNGNDTIGRAVAVANVKPNTTYTMSGCLNSEYYRCEYDREGNVVLERTIGAIFTTGANTTIVKCFGGQMTETAPIKNVNEIKFQLEESPTPTTYEPYKSTTLTTPEEITLRGIGDVKDTLNTVTGEYTQRIGEVVLDGSESWYCTTDTDTTQRFYFNSSKINLLSDTNSLLILSDKLPTVNKVGVVGIIKWWNGTTSNINIRHTSQTTDEFKKWLSQNPITVHYPLATPITSTVSLTFTNQDNQPTTKLSTYNTTTHIDASSQEGSLIPTLSHVNPSYPVILKPSTKYSIVADSYSNDHTNSPINFNLGGATVSTTVGNRVCTVTTPSTLTSEELVMSGQGNKLNNVMVIEGDVVGDEAYFEGMCDCKSPILSNCGKNLFDKNTVIQGYYNGSDIFYNDSKFITYENPISVIPDTEYIFSNNIQTKYGRVNFYDKNMKILSAITDLNLSPFTTPSGCYFIRISTYRNTGITPSDIEWSQLETGRIATSYEPYKSNILSCNGDRIELTEDMFEQGTINANVNQPFEQCKGSTTQRLRNKELLQLKQGVYNISIPSDYSLIVASFRNGLYESTSGWQGSKYTLHVVDTSTSFGFIIKKNDNTTITTANFNESHFEIREVDKTIVLRSLPNGVCDTLDLMTGEYVQRIGEVVFDGSSDEGWTWFSGKAWTGLISNKVKYTDITDCRIQSDRYACDNYTLAVSNGNMKFGLHTNKNLEIRIDSVYSTIQQWTQSLSNNPVTVQYELATPITTTIDLQGSPYAYKDGHIQLTSGSIEQSLTPIIEYSLPTNRNGQIRSNQKMVEKHQKELDKLQAIILANLVNSQYNQTLTTLNYELSRV